MNQKPHLYRRWGIWCCRLLDVTHTYICGHGYTPREAYDDWKAQAQ